MSSPPGSPRKAIGSPPLSPRTKLRREFQSVVISRGTIAEMKSLALAPPADVKSVLGAMLLALGVGSGEWPVVCHFLTTTSAEEILRRLKSFNPSKLTPATTRKMKQLVGKLTVERVQSSSGVAGALYCWVRSVYAQASYDESSLSNFAVLSPGLAHTPYAGLRRYQPAGALVQPPY